jgi:quinol-cytochrome oxidoreductase complex cytochrome b subunit
MSESERLPSQPSPEPREVLAYSAAPFRPTGRQILLRTFLFFLGIAIGIAAIGFLGLGLWNASGYTLNHSPHPYPIWPAIVFFAILTAAFTACVLVFRRFRKAVKWLLMGLFIAAGFASLAEGFCFLNQ